MISATLLIVGLFFAALTTIMFFCGAALAGRDDLFPKFFQRNATLTILLLLASIALHLKGR